MRRKTMTAQFQEISLPVAGMTSVRPELAPDETTTSCVGHVEKALKAVPGVEQVVVNLGSGNASLVYDVQKASIADLRKAVENVGYTINQIARHTRRSFRQQEIKDGKNGFYCYRKTNLTPERARIPA